MAGTPQFHLSRKDLNALIPNKSKSYCSQNLQREVLFVIRADTQS